MKKIYHTVWLACLLCLPILAQANHIDPVKQLNGLTQHVISKLQQNKTQLKADPKIASRLIRQFILPQLDTQTIARASLGKQVWGQASRSQQQRFTQALSELVIRTYAAALSQYSNERVKFFPLSASDSKKKRIRVSSRIIRPNGPPLRVDYRMIHRGNQWKIYDLNIEGVSLLRNFRSQFAAKLRSENLDQLIQALQQQDQGTS